MTIYIYSHSKYGAALYNGCWSCTNYGAAGAAPAVWLSPPMMRCQLRIYCSKGGPHRISL